MLQFFYQAYSSMLKVMHHRILEKLQNLTVNKHHFTFFHSDNAVRYAYKDHWVHKEIMDNCYIIITELVNYKYLSIIES